MCVCVCVCVKRLWVRLRCKEEICNEKEGGEDQQSLKETK